MTYAYGVFRGCPATPGSAVVGSSISESDDAPKASIATPSRSDAQCPLQARRPRSLRLVRGSKCVAPRP